MLTSEYLPTYFPSCDADTPCEHVTLGDGATFTFYGDKGLLASLAASGNQGLKEGDEVRISTRGDSLFIRHVEVVRKGEQEGMKSQHGVTNLYGAGAVNVDQGLAQNIANAAKNIQRKEGKVDADPDVEDDEWDD